MSLASTTNLKSAISTTPNLNVYLDRIWQRHFSDILRANEIEIAYCQPWKRRLGLIRMTVDNKTSFIGINALLQHSQVPEYVLITTIAHELAQMRAWLATAAAVPGDVPEYQI